MKKIGLIFKETSENRIKNYLKDSNAVFIIKYSGLSSPDLTQLRKNLRTSNATFFIVKNSVARRALEGSELKLMVKSIEGPCGMIFVKEEPVSASKVLCSFSKEHEQLKLEGVYLDIEQMSKLPSKEALRAQVVMALNSPISGLVITLNQILAKFVYCLNQIKQKKSN
jgi:ribosomal protein L10